MQKNLERTPLKNGLKIVVKKTTGATGTLKKAILYMKFIHWKEKDK